MRDINWREWSDAAFDESRGSGKPVLLSISAVWCHWCHVMDRTTYSEPAVVQFVNEHFIPIRVDSDRNPDINTRYNMGGWPTTAFLTAERDIMAGFTYVAPEHMVRILKAVFQEYSSQRPQLTEKARSQRLLVQEHIAGVGSRGAGLGDAGVVLSAIRSSYDNLYGGFGTGQKFPQASALGLLLFAHERLSDHGCLEMVTGTLDAMIGAEMLDPVEGGLFRYATQRDWTQPHYEKMLDDNARIAAVLVKAHRLTGSEEYLTRAQGIFAYLELVLMDRDSGAFRGSQDADEHYYSLDADGRRAIQPPRVDSAVYTDTNSLAAIAYLTLWAETADEHARQTALRLLDYFNCQIRAPDGTVCHYVEDGVPLGHGNLTDQVHLALANIAAYSASGRESYFRHAADLVGTLGPAFAAEKGAFHDISLDRSNERSLTRHATPLAENSIAAICLAHCAALTDEPDYKDSVVRTLDAISGHYEAYGILAADYARAVAVCATPQLGLTITGADDSLRRAAFRVVGLDAAVNTAPDGAAPGAVICLGSACSAPIVEPSALEAELSEAMRRKIKPGLGEPA